MKSLNIKMALTLKLHSEESETTVEHCNTHAVFYQIYIGCTICSPTYAKHFIPEVHHQNCIQGTREILVMQFAMCL